MVLLRTDELLTFSSIDGKGVLDFLNRERLVNKFRFRFGRRTTGSGGGDGEGERESIDFVAAILG